MRESINLSGVAAMLAATASFVAGDSFLKLVATDLPPFEVLFLRGVAASLGRKDHGIGRITGAEVAGGNERGTSHSSYTRSMSLVPNSP